MIDFHALIYAISYTSLIVISCMALQFFAERRPRSYWTIEDASIYNHAYLMMETTVKKPAKMPTKGKGKSGKGKKG